MWDCDRSLFAADSQSNMAAVTCEKVDFGTTE